MLLTPALLSQISSMKFYYLIRKINVNSIVWDKKAKPGAYTTGCLSEICFFCESYLFIFYVRAIIQDTSAARLSAESSKSELRDF